MEIGNKVIAAGIGLFILGGLSVYLLMVPKSDTPERKLTSRQHSAMQAAVAQLEQQEPQQETEKSEPPEIIAKENNGADEATGEMTHAAFLAAAEARRAQNMEDKAETERLEKLRKIKQNSTECKFWKQQQKGSSAAAKIEEKIIQFCTLQDTSSAANSDVTSSIASSENDLAPQNPQTN